MHAFDVLGDPIRRRILELLADGERSAGEITSIVQDEFGISQPGVSQHLRVLRESGFTSVHPVGTRRLYAVDPVPLKEVDVWLEQFRRLWEESFERLDEVLLKMKAKEKKKEERHGRKNK
jgi:DNA-binding transcriptional ArsR family regulator